MKDEYQTLLENLLTFPWRQHYDHRLDKLSSHQQTSRSPNSACESTMRVTTEVTLRSAAKPQCKTFLF